MTVVRRAVPVLGVILVIAGGWAFLSGLRDEPRPADQPSSARQTAPVEPRASGPSSSGRRVAGGPRPAPPSRPETDDPAEPWIERNNEAAALLEAGELDAALPILEECHAAVPDSDVFRRNLAEALVRLARRLYEVDHELEPAIARLARAIELAPDRDDATDLQRVLDRWRREAELAANHATDESDYFELSYDAAREDVYRRSGAVIAFLEGTYGELRDWFHADPVIVDRRPRIQVVLYGRADFDALTGLGDWAGGVFDGVVRISVEDVGREETRWQNIARHELVHAFIHEVGGSTVPGWLNEGLAQWLDTAARARLVADARATIADGRLFPLERLEGSLATWKDADDIARAYAQSLVLVDHIAQYYGEHALRALVVGARDGRSAAAFQEAAGVPLSFVVEDLPNYL